MVILQSLLSTPIHGKMHKTSSWSLINIIALVQGKMTQTQLTNMTWATISCPNPIYVLYWSPQPSYISYYSIVIEHGEKSEREEWQSAIEGAGGCGYTQYLQYNQASAKINKGQTLKGTEENWGASLFWRAHPQDDKYQSPWIQMPQHSLQVSQVRRYLWSYAGCIRMMAKTAAVKH